MFKRVRIATKVSLLEKYSLLGRIAADSPLNPSVVVGEITELKSTVHSILKRLKEREVNFLSRSIESKGGLETECVLFGLNERLGRRLVKEPQVILYRVFREPNVRNSAQLKRRLCCTHIHGQDGKVCINPYHYSIILEADLGRQMFQVFANVIEKKETDSSGFYSNCTATTACELGTISSAKTATSLATDYFHGGRKRPWPWCYIAYWEHSDRIGPLFEGFDETINVYENLPLPGGSGFRLAALDRNPEVADVVKRVRDHIGFGLQVTREGDGVWLYNRSDYSLFANGPTLAQDSSAVTPSRHNIRVHKIPSGCSLKVYDYSQAPGLRRTLEKSCPVPHTVRVSFAKGWGTTNSNSYCRPFVTSCPCWVEIHFFVYR